MIEISKIYELLSGALSVKVYPDVVPESAPKPAASYINLGYGGKRLIDGKLSGEFEEWRITLVVTEINDIYPLVAELKLIDNTSNSDFSNIYITMDRIEAIDEYSPYRRAFLDLELRG